MSLEHAPSRDLGSNGGAGGAVPGAPGAPGAATIFLDQRQLAELLGLSQRTVERMRCLGTGPPYSKFGRRVRYLTADVMAWADAQKRRSTSEEPGHAA